MHLGSLLVSLRYQFHMKIRDSVEPTHLPYLSTLRYLNHECRIVNDELGLGFRTSDKTPKKEKTY